MKLLLKLNAGALLICLFFASCGSPALTPQPSSNSSEVSGGAFVINPLPDNLIINHPSTLSITSNISFTFEKAREVNFNSFKAFANGESFYETNTAPSGIWEADASRGFFSGNLDSQFDWNTPDVGIYKIYFEVIFNVNGVTQIFTSPAKKVCVADPNINNTDGTNSQEVNPLSTESSLVKLISAGISGFQDLQGNVISCEETILFRFLNTPRLTDGLETNPNPHPYLDFALDHTYPTDSCPSNANEIGIHAIVRVENAGLPPAFAIVQFARGDFATYPIYIELNTQRTSTGEYLSVLASSKKSQTDYTLQELFVKIPINPDPDQVNPQFEIISTESNPEEQESLRTLINIQTLFTQSNQDSITPNDSEITLTPEQTPSSNTQLGSLATEDASTSEWEGTPLEINNGDAPERNNLLLGYLAVFDENGNEMGESYWEGDSLGCDTGGTQPLETPTLVPVETATPTQSDPLNFTLTNNAVCRAGPNNQFKIAEYITGGTTVQAFARSENSEWVRVVLPNKVNCWTAVKLGVLSGEISQLPLENLQFIQTTPGEQQSGGGGILVDQDSDGYTSNVDCNDNSDKINPGAPDFPGDFTDSNCNGDDDT